MVRKTARSKKAVEVRKRTRRRQVGLSIREMGSCAIWSRDTSDKDIADSTGGEMTKGVLEVASSRGSLSGLRLRVETGTAALAVPSWLHSCCDGKTWLCERRNWRFREEEGEEMGSMISAGGGSRLRGCRFQLGSYCTGAAGDITRLAGAMS